MPRSLRVYSRAASAALLGLAVALCAGCGGAATGTVSGKVTVNNQPLKDGLITFLSDAGNRDAFSARITNGEYRTDAMPVGTARVYITPPMEMPTEGPQGGDLQPPPKVVKKALVPEKYTRVETADLKLTVNKGENTFDVPMSH